LQLRLAYEAVVGIGYAVLLSGNSRLDARDLRRFPAAGAPRCLETRREYLERLPEAADAGVELASANGKWSTN
jgi:hypothetical protein